MNDLEFKAYFKKAEYMTLAKIEELEEQNYNMIDNVLDNGVEKFNREEDKPMQHFKNFVSLKKRLSVKQYEISLK